MGASGPAGAALEALDRALAARPRADGHAFSEAAHQLCLLRDGLAARLRDGGGDADGRRRLAHVNGVISVVLAGHFPLGDVPWPELEKARAWLVGLVDDRVSDRADDQMAGR